MLASRGCGWLLQPLLKKRPHVKLRLLCHSTARHRFGVTFLGGLWGDRRPSRCLTPSLGLLLGSMPPAALEPGELSSILIVEYDNDVYDNDDSDDNDNGDDNDAKLHSPLRWLTFAVRLKELTRGILDAISIRRRQGCSHEPSQREPAGKGKEQADSRP